MAEHVAEFEVLGPWSLQTSRRFWEGFTPAALAAAPAGPGLRTVFCAEGDWRRAEAEVTRAGDTTRLVLAGDGDLDAAAAQARRFLALDVDGRGWPEVGRRDPVIADAQARLPGLRPCGFHSPYEAAAWSVLSQRLRISQAARLRTELIARHSQGCRALGPTRGPRWCAARWLAPRACGGLAAGYRPRPGGPPAQSAPAPVAAPGHARRSGRSPTRRRPARSRRCPRPRCRHGRRWTGSGSSGPRMLPPPA